MNNIVQVEEYVRPDGSVPYKDWFNSLDKTSSKKVARAKSRMELGNLSSVKWFGGIGEYKIDWGPGYRIYLGKDGTALIILLGGGTKAHQSADIAKAMILWEEYKTNKKAARTKNVDSATGDDISNQ